MPGPSTKGKVGLLLKRPESVFSNGCVQQPLFLKKTLVAAGFEVVFLGIEANYTVFEHTDEPILQTTPATDFSSFDCVILASVILVENENNTPYIRNLERYGVIVINFVCGNIFVLHQEEFVFAKHHIMHHYMQKYYKVNWVMEMYDYARDYLQMMSGVSTRICPYVWDPDIVRSYVDANSLCKTMGDVRDKINVVVFEANMSIHKNALVPILICEEFYRRWPDRLNTVYLFCSDSVVPQSEALVEGLRVFRDKKVEVYGRIVMPYIMDMISKTNPYLTTCLSYTVMNRLNFLHLELMYLGIPIVHNCQPFDNGYWYGDFELMRAAEILDVVRTGFDKDVYRERCEPIIRSFASDHPDRVSGYSELINEAVALRRSAPTVGAPTVGAPTVGAPTVGAPTVGAPLFLKGSGYVIPMDHDRRVPELCEAIRVGIWKPDLVVELVGSEPTQNERQALEALSTTLRTRFVAQTTFKEPRVMSWIEFDRSPNNPREWFP